MLSSLQSSQSSGGAADGCEGVQIYPPTAPIMLQVSCTFSVSVGKAKDENPTRTQSQTIHQGAELRPSLVFINRKTFARSIMASRELRREAH